MSAFVKKTVPGIAAVQLVAREIEDRLGKRGRLLLRYSGTESLARVMIEGESEPEITTKLTGWLMKFVERLVALIDDLLVFP